MKNRSLIVAFAFVLTISVAACTSGSSSSTDQSKVADSQATARQQPPTPDTPPEEPALAEVKDVPTPKPLGWAAYDSYFQQLLVVYDYVLKDSVPEVEAKKLLDRATALAKDNDKEHEPTAPMRKMLEDQVTRFMESSHAMVNKEQWMMMFTQVLMGSQEIVMRGTADKIQGYPEKLESMRISVDNKLLLLRSRR